MRSLTIQIDKPCHELWEEMTPNERGRFCASCQKTVVDYTKLSDQELVWLLNKDSGSICGRLRTDQLNRPLLSSTVRSFGWRRWVGMLTTALLSWKTAFSQYNSLGMPMVNSIRPEISVSPIPIRSSKTETYWSVSGRAMLVDSSGNLTPSINAFVDVYGLEKTVQTRTDSTGRYKVSVSRQTQNVMLSIRVIASNHNRATTTVEITPADTSITINDIVISNSIKLTSVSISTGGLTICRKPSLWQKTKRKLFTKK